LGRRKESRPYNARETGDAHRDECEWAFIILQETNKS